MTFLSDATVAHLRAAAGWPSLDDRYTVTGVAGRGGAGTVYIAHDRILDRDVAIKVVDVADRAGRSAERLSREAMILARLDHPGTVPVHDRGVLPDGRAFYVMKLVRGRRLAEAVAAEPMLAERLALFARILDAVGFAHAHGVVHRDLKPDNVLVGAFGEVFVMDWGVASSLALPDSEPAVVGTPGFMPPEQAAAEKVDARADVFALGAVLAGVIGDDAPKPLSAIAKKASATEAARRYQTVREMATDLAHFRDGRTVSAYREPLNERLLRLYRRYELPILLVVAYVVMRAALLAWKGF
jgi:serine/threonine protein kinase